MYLLRGFVGYLGVLLVLCVFAHGAAQLAARWLGGAPFRWFDGQATAMASWRRFAVRAFSSVVPVLFAVGLAFFAILARGDVIGSTRVHVQDGPAKTAGLLDGDRILAIDSQPVNSFDEIRSELQTGWGEKTLAIEREQRKFMVVVTPVERRIGIAPVLERRPLGIGDALARALELPAMLGETYLEAPFTTGTEPVQLRGSVGIVRDTERQRGAADFFHMLALIALTFSPMVAGLHVFDSLTARLFRATHTWIVGSAFDSRVTHLARIHQTLWIALLGFVLLAGLLVLHETRFGEGALFGGLLLAPTFPANVLLVGTVAALRFGWGVGVVAILASLFIPCAVLVLAGVSMAWVRAELVRRRFGVRGLIAEPASED